MNATVKLWRTLLKYIQCAKWITHVESESSLVLKKISFDWLHQAYIGGSRYFWDWCDVYTFTVMHTHTYTHTHTHTHIYIYIYIERERERGGERERKSEREREKERESEPKNGKEGVPKKILLKYLHKSLQVVNQLFHPRTLTSFISLNE